MSQETTEWFNEGNAMIGFVAHREKWANNAYVRVDSETQKVKAWWAKEGFEFAYDDAIPAEEVERVLFHWEPVETQVWNRLYVGDDDDNYDSIDGTGKKFLWVLDEQRKGIMRPDTQQVFNYFGADSYQVHGYKEWLMDKVVTILDGEAGIASAGLLRGGGVAYVCVELPEGIETDAGLEIRPSLTAATSLDGTRATAYKMGAFAPVCDNSLTDILTGAGKGIKIKHSAKSIGRLNDAREALGLIYQHGEEMVAFLDACAKVEVTEAAFHEIVAELVPVPVEKPDGKGGVSNKGAITNAENRQEEIHHLWYGDDRAKPWRGTLLGAYQAVNTWNEHYRSNDDNPVTRVMGGTLDGRFAKEDQVFWSIVGGLSEVGRVDMRPVASLLVKTGSE